MPNDLQLSGTHTHTHRHMNTKAHQAPELVPTFLAEPRFRYYFDTFRPFPSFLCMRRGRDRRASSALEVSEGLYQR